MKVPISPSSYYPNSGRWSTSAICRALIALMCVIAFMAIFLFAMAEDSRVRDGFPRSGLTRAEILQAMKYHGILIANLGHDGRWYFQRDGKTFRLWLPSRRTDNAR